MFYIYCIVIFLVGLIVFYWAYQIRMSRKFLTAVSLQMHYRFQDLEDKYSGNGRAKNGALVFSTVRNGDDLRNVVVKSVKLSHANFKVNMNHFMMITFPSNSNTAHEASLRFRITGKHIKKAEHYAHIKGFITLESCGRLPFRIRIPVSSSEE